MLLSPCCCCLPSLCLAPLLAARGSRPSGQQAAVCVPRHPPAVTPPRSPPPQPPAVAPPASRRPSCTCRCRTPAAPAARSRPRAALGHARSRSPTSRRARSHLPSRRRAQVPAAGRRAWLWRTGGGVKGIGFLLGWPLAQQKLRKIQVGLGPVGTWTFDSCWAPGPTSPAAAQVTDNAEDSSSFFNRKKHLPAPSFFNPWHPKPRGRFALLQNSILRGT